MNFHQNMFSSSSSDEELVDQVIIQLLQNTVAMAAEFLRRQQNADLSDEEGTESDAEDEIPLHLRPLVAAAESGDLNALRLALENYEGNIDDPMEDGDTLLHLTCHHGHLNCVKFLLAKGSNLEAKDAEGGIPLHDACEGGYTEIVQLIITHANELECVKRMLETVDTEGDTPLHHAAREKHGDITRLLLAHGASPTKTNKYGETPLELAPSETEAWRVLKEAVVAMAKD